MKDLHNEHTTADAIVDAALGNEKQLNALEATERARSKYVLPSFGAKLFTGIFDPSFLIPFPKKQISKEADDVIEKLCNYLQTALNPDEIDVSRTFPEDVLQEMKQQRIFALKVPKEYGGLGFSQTEYAALLMKVASYCSATAVLISAHQSIGVPQPLLMFGTKEQKAKYFPRFCQGAISAFALTEPGVGSDPAEMSCSATKSEDGKSYILNGQKLWCTNGPIADLIVVMAKTPAKLVNGKTKQQISAFIVETNTPGLKWTHRCEFMGLGAIYNGLLTLTDVVVPKENILGEEGRGLALALSTLNIGRLSIPAASTGAAKQLLTIARRFGASRVQWGMPVGQHEFGQQKIARIASLTFAMEAMTWLTSAFADEGKVDIRIEAAMAKFFCTEALWEIVDDTMQLNGGRGYERAASLKARGDVPYPVERIMRDTRINRIFEGSSEIIKLFLAREALDSHLQRLAPIFNRKTSILQKFKTLCNLSVFYSAWYLKQSFKGLFANTGQKPKKIAPYFAYIDRAASKLAKEIFKSIVRHRQHLDKKQLVLGRLMEIGIDLFAMSATASYALCLDAQGKKEVMELADCFLQETKRKIEDNFISLRSNADKATNTLAQSTLKGKFKWLENGIIWIGPNE